MTCCIRILIVRILTYVMEYETRQILHDHPQCVNIPLEGRRAWERDWDFTYLEGGYLPSKLLLVF
jgi:hypothetical protein